MNTRRFSMVAIACGLSLQMSPLANAQQGGQTTYKMGRKAIVSVTNSYGPITIKAVDDNEVRATYISRAKSVVFDNQRRGKRVTLIAGSSGLGDNLAEYSVLVPRHAFVILFAGGAIHVEGIAGDVTAETVDSSVEVKNAGGAHVHVRTLDGPIILAGIRNSHVYVNSVNGPINMADVRASWVEATSSSGRITYDGDPGSDGEYRLTSHSGDLEVSIPASALVEINTSPLSGQSDVASQEAATSSLFQRGLCLNPGGLARAHLNLRSFTGRVRFKRLPLH